MYTKMLKRCVNEHVVSAVGRPVESDEDSFLKFTQSFSSHLFQCLGARTLDRLTDVVVVLDAYRVHHEQHRRQHEQ